MDKDDKLSRLDPEKNPYILVDPIDRFSQREEIDLDDGRAPMMNFGNLALAAQAEEQAKKYLSLEVSEQLIKPGFILRLSANGKIFIIKDGFSKGFDEASTEDLKTIANFRG